MTYTLTNEKGFRDSIFSNFEEVPENLKEKVIPMPDFVEGLKVSDYPNTKFVYLESAWMINPNYIDREKYPFFPIRLIRVVIPNHYTRKGGQLTGFAYDILTDFVPSRRYKDATDSNEYFLKELKESDRNILESFEDVQIFEYPN